MALALPTAAIPTTVVPKPVVQSSTVWGNAALGAGVAGLAALWPAFGTFITAHPTIMVAVSSGLNILWRIFVTKQPISGVITSP